MADVARAWLAAVPGVRVEEAGVHPRRPMLVATLESAAPGPTLVMCGHLDTVPEGEGWTRDPFGAQVRGRPPVRARRVPT